MHRVRRRASRAVGCLAVTAALAAGVTGCATFGLSPAGPGTPAAQGTPRASQAGPAPGSPAPRPAPRSPAPAAKPLAGKTVGIDPGHNGLNGSDPAFLAHQIWNGRAWENCNTTGTQTDAGYTEALFNFKVAMYLVADLRRDGARVVLTRWSNSGVGPCVDKRSTMLNGTDIAIDIHGDGGPAWGRGFTVLEPVADGPNNKVIGPSIRFGSYVHQAFLADTPLRASDYYGHDGYIFRSDLAGLNLTTVPKVLIECGNMRNLADAALLTSSRVQQQIARGLEAAIIRYLTGRWPQTPAG